MPPLRDPAPVRVRVKAKKKPTVAAQQRKSYAAQPVAGRQAQLASKGVLAPKYAKTIKTEHKRRVTQLKTDPGARERLEKREVVRALQAAKPPTARLTPVKPKKSSGLAAITNIVARASPFGAGVQPAVGAAAQALDKATKGKAVKTGVKIAKNAPADAAEIAVTTPTSIAHLVSTAVHDPKKLPGMFVEPYKQLAKDPGKFITEKPVSTALMFQPAVRVPGLAAGRAARTAGKQTLRGTPKTLPGTALRQETTRSRSAFRNARQAKAEAKRGPQRMTDKEVKRRVDEFYAVGKLQTNRVLNRATERVQAKAAQLPEAARAEYVAKEMKGAKKGARKQVHRMFAEEFGATARPIIPGGRGVVRPKNARDAVLHATREDAQTVASRMPFEASVVKVGKQKFGVVPSDALARLKHHQSIGKSKATGARVLRVGGQQFRTAILPTSTRWLFGQATEAGFRAGVAGAGPRSSKLAKRIVDEMERQEPGSGKALLMRAAPGGVFGLSGTAREFAYGQRTLADQFERSALHKPASALTAVGTTPGLKQVRAGYRTYTEHVYNAVNRIERAAQVAMLGKAIRKSGLIDRKLMRASDEAIADAARGLRNTESQVRLGREVDRAYGKYNKYGPDMREFLLHWSPFAPWARNMVEFLGVVLPADHPVLTSVLATSSSATEEWRKKQGLSLRGGEGVPDYMMGGAKIGGKVIPIGKVLPFAPGGNVLDTAGGLLVPQYASLGKNLFLGTDWKNKELSRGGGIGVRLKNAAATGAETFIPGAGAFGRVTGLTGRHVRGTDEPTIVSGKNVGKALLREANPLRPPAETSGRSGGKSSSRWDTKRGGSRWATSTKSDRWR